MLVYAIDEAGNMSGSNEFRVIIAGNSNVFIIILVSNIILLALGALALVAIYFTIKKNKGEKNNQN